MSGEGYSLALVLLESQALHYKHTDEDLMMTTQFQENTGIYADLDPAIDHPHVNGDRFFGVYRRSPKFPSKFTLMENFDYSKEPGSFAATKFKESVSTEDIQNMIQSVMNQETLMFSSSRISTILDSIADDGNVTKKIFADAFVSAIQTPQAAAVAAASALFALAKKDPNYKKDLLQDAQSSDDKMPEAIYFTSIAYGGLRINVTKDFLSSPQVFRADGFSKNPLTEAEIKAIPAVSGFYTEAYELAGQDHRQHAQSIIKKLDDAGFEIVAKQMALHNGFEPKPTSPDRARTPYEEGPSL